MNIDILASTVPMVGLRLGASLIFLVAFVALLLGTGVCQSVRRRRRAGQRVLMLGTKPLARWIIEEIDRRRDLGWAIVGVVEDVDKLALALDATRPDRIIVGLPAGVPCCSKLAPEESTSRAPSRLSNGSPASSRSRRCRPAASCTPTTSSRGDGSSS